MTEIDPTEIKDIQPEISIEISSDEMQAYLICKSEVDGKISEDFIYDILSSAGITYGVRSDIITDLASQLKSSKRILIAEGRNKTAGPVTNLKLIIESKEPVKINKGDVVGEFELGGSGEPAITVKGNEVPENETSFQVEHFENIIADKERPSTLVASCSGYYSHTDEIPKVVAFGEIELSDDQLTAWITLTTPSGGIEVNNEDIFEFLQVNQIVYGIDDKLVGEIITEKIFDEKLVVAQGDKAIDPKHGFIRYFFERDVQPVLDEQGNVDYKNMNLIQNIRKGEPIYEIVETVPGEPGKDVLGEEIQSEEAKPVDPPKSNAVVVSEEHPLQFVALESGHVVFRKDVIEIEPIYEVKGDIDYSTGNLEFIGNITIKGDVKSGFTVLAEGDIEIDGYVEDAIIEASGNIMLKSGFGGKGQGRLKAGGLIIAKFCENQTVICESDIKFCEYILHSTIHTTGKLFVTEQKGLIVGGEVYASQGIEVKIVGNRNYTPTKIIAGINKNVLDEIEELEPQIEVHEENLKKLEEGISLLKTRKVLLNSLTDKQKLILKKLLLAMKTIQGKREKIMLRIDELKEQFDLYKDAEIKVADNVFPRTVVGVYESHKKIEEETGPVNFRYGEEGLETFE